MTTEKTEVIDFTPTWLGILPYLVAAVRDGETVEARRAGEEELRKMAGLADAHVATLQAVMPLAKRLRDALDKAPRTGGHASEPQGQEALTELILAARELASRF